MNNMKPEGICDVQMSTMAKRAPRRVCGYVICLKPITVHSPHGRADGRAMGIVVMETFLKWTTR